MRGARGKHPGDEASGMRGARGKHEASRLKGSGRIDRAFLGRLVLGPSPIRAFGLASWLMELGLGPWYPQCPPFFLPGGAIAPSWKKEQA